MSWLGAMGMLEAWELTIDMLTALVGIDVTWERPLGT